LRLDAKRTLIRALADKQALNPAMRHRNSAHEARQLKHLVHQAAGIFSPWIGALRPLCFKQ